jgi:hypothetical protein
MRLIPPHACRYNGAECSPLAAVDVAPSDAEALRAEGWIDADAAARTAKPPRKKEEQ